MPDDLSQKFLRRAFVKTLLRRTIALILLVGVIYGLTAIVYATRTIFKVNYWSQSKDILGVTYFGDLVPEVMHFGEDYEEILLELIETRIKYKLNKYRGNKPPEEIKAEILKKKDILKTRVEKEILSRLAALRRYLRTPAHDPHISLEEIFRKRKSGMKNLFRPFRAYIQKRREKIANTNHSKWFQNPISPL
jgi:hypothetical protein